MAVESTNKKNVPLGRVRLPKGFNIRGDELPEAERDQIVRSFEEHGIIHDASVEEHAPRGKGKVYLVTEGFGRMAALLYMWERAGRPRDWRVTVTVVSYTSRLDPFMRNLAENVHRRAVRQADLARRLSQIVKGELPDPKGGWVEDRATVAELAAKLQLSESFVRELVRAWDKAVPAVREAWRRDQVRTDHVRAWATLPEEAQRMKLEATLRGEQTLAARRGAPGPQPSAVGLQPESRNGTAADGVSPVSRERPSEPSPRSAEHPRGVEAEGGGRRADGDAGPRPPSRAEILARAAAVGEDLDSGAYTGKDLVARRAAWAALRWAAGEVRTMRLT